MNVISCITKMKPQTISKVNALCTMAEESETMKDLFDKFAGCDAKEAYARLTNLSDHELRIIAAFIGEANRKFDRRAIR